MLSPFFLGQFIKGTPVACIAEIKIGHCMPKSFTPSCLRYQGIFQVCAPKVN